jgi:hypothetical protein
VDLPAGGGSYAMLTRANRDLSPAAQALVTALRAAAGRKVPTNQP